MLSCFESPLFKYYKVFNGDVVATFTATAPSPQRDFIHLQILKDKVIVVPCSFLKERLGFVLFCLIFH